MILDSFRCTARDLADPGLKGWSKWIRLDGDSDDPGTWHPVKIIRSTGFSSASDPDLPAIAAVTVSFLDDTPEKILNKTDQVECAIPRPF